jgi:hypothetical protein
VAVQSQIPNVGDDTDNPAQRLFDFRSNILANENPLSYRIRWVAQEAARTPEPSTAERWDKIGQIHE